jgi:hypothetical protein
MTLRRLAIGGGVDPRRLRQCGRYLRQLKAAAKIGAIDLPQGLSSPPAR